VAPLPPPRRRATLGPRSLHAAARLPPRSGRTSLGACARTRCPCPWPVPYPVLPSQLPVGLSDRPPQRGHHLGPTEIAADVPDARYRETADLRAMRIGARRRRARRRRALCPLNVGGPEMAPHTPHTPQTPRRSRGAPRYPRAAPKWPPTPPKRSARPGEAVARLD